jgi:hypothetical protein
MEHDFMSAIIRAGLIAGAIGGEAMILLVLVNTILLKNIAAEQNLKTTPGLVAFWGVAYPLIVILLFEGGGIFSSWLCRVQIQTRRDALIAGTITGITMGIILEIMWMANILSLASRSMKLGSGILAGNGNSLVVIFLLLILIIMGSILSAFGSYIYSAHIFRGKGQVTIFG